MVARINTGKSLSKALNYNEHKVQEGKAEIPAGFRFIKDVDQLNFYDKTNHFEWFKSPNIGATTNMLLVSLNFDPSGKISKERIIKTAGAYMNKNGLENQPHLGDRYHDASHPNIHIVGLNIEKNRNRICMHNLGRNYSDKARKEIEIAFGLVRAHSKKDLNVSQLVPVNAQKISNGKLKDTPINSSAFFMKPTLSFLEKKFGPNEAIKAPHKKRLQTTIGWILTSQPSSLEVLISARENENVSTVIRKEKEVASMALLTWITKPNAFQWNILCKQYNAKAFLEKCGLETVLQPETAHKEKSNYKKATERQVGLHKETKPDRTLLDFTCKLEYACAVGDYVPYQLKKKNKKKKYLFI